MGDARFKWSGPAPSDSLLPAPTSLNLQIDSHSVQNLLSDMSDGCMAIDLELDWNA